MNAKRESKQAYIAKRRKAVEDLYVRKHLATADIARQLVDEGVLQTTDETLESAIRIVRGDIKDLREGLTRNRLADADRSVAITEVDVLESELTELCRERDRQKMIADGEPDANGHEAVTVVMMMGIGGEPYPFEKAKWPASVRQKASKDAATLTQKISKVETVLAEKRKTLHPDSGGEVSELGGGGFSFNFSGKSLDALLGARIGTGDGAN